MDREEFDKTFCEFDADGSGALEKEEAKTFIKAIFALKGRDISEAGQEIIFNMLDTMSGEEEADGKITQDNLWEIVNKE